MNINAIQKHYDKLTIKERFAALVAAGMRGDDQERDALLRSAPRKVFSFPNTYGLSDTFEFLSMWHVLNQLGYVASFYCLLGMGDDEREEIFDGALAGLLFFLTNCEAWRAICKEYGVDPEKILEGLPFAEIMTMTELVALRVYDALYNAPLELPELQETIDGLRAVIETKRKDWE
jgi:hypothetical protein